ncbi:MAG: FIST N-terminal domain-containing protein [Leptospiraceae bacterium]|nr:FIST N-terminal domain-containing protein [Leptospiraceae bacterium]
MIQTTTIQNPTEINKFTNNETLGLILTFYGSEFPYKELYETLKNTKIPFLGCMDIARLEGNSYNFSEKEAVCIFFPKEMFSKVSIVAYDMRNTSSYLSIESNAKDQFDRAFLKTGINPSNPDIEREFAIHLLYGLQSGNPALNSFVNKSMFLQSVGGSSGGKLDFKHSSVICSKGFGAIGATALIKLKPEYSILIERVSSFQKLEPTLEVTSLASPRHILELNGKPAAREYAANIGKQISELTPSVFADYTLGIEPGDGERLITSIMKSDDSGEGLLTYNDLQTGTVLNLYKAILQKEDRKKKLDSLPKSNMIAYISFDCVLCYLTRDANHEIDTIAELYNSELGQIPKIGFGTFSENFCGANVNQTETLLAIYRNH